MIYIGTTDNNGSAIYFDIYAAVRQRNGLRISGTIGDGCYEGEVLVEVGRSDSVTFADAWLGGAGFAEFMERCDSTLLTRALLESVRDMPLAPGRRSRPHGNNPVPVGIAVAETSPVWGRCV